ncbi:MAG: hemolysin family protein [Verrucomicrobiota bacterium]|jgi:CBS domain containing-hemolysin-like protein
MNTELLAANALRLLAILAIVLVNGFFVAAEFAFVKLRATQLDALIVAGHRRARLARHILQNLTAYLSATQLGITMASLGLGWLAEPVFMALLAPPLGWVGVRSPHVQQSVAFAVGFSTATFLQIVLGELGPKWFAIQKALPTSLFVAAPLHWFYRLSYPFNWVLNQSAQWLLRRVGLEPSGFPLFVHSEEELRLMLGQSQAAATRLGHEIVLNALDLSRRIVRNVMRPRQQLVVFDTEATVAQCLELAEKTRYSRFPLCEGGDLDKTLGVVHIKDLFAVRAKAARGADLAGVARKLIYVPETTRLEKLLQLFLERKLHFAIVVDEYGGTVGMVTLENVLEELVGQIQDEFDQEKPLLLRRDDNHWEIDGALPLHELADLVGQNLSAPGIATTSGWVTQRLGGFPKTGDALTLGAYELRVEQTVGARVARLKLTRQAGRPAPAE